MAEENRAPIKENLFNIPVNLLTTEQFFEHFDSLLDSNVPVRINFLNSHCFNVAQTNTEYRHALEQSTFLLNDGVGVSIAAWLCGLKFPENLNGTDLIPQILELFARRNMSVFLLGAKPTVIERTVEELRKQYPDLEIAGYADGYFSDTDEMVRRIAESGADALVAGMGVPKQELWIDRNAGRLGHARVFIAGGAVFDFIAGEFKRAPMLVRKMKLEWLYRLSQEPLRLFSRYVTGGFVFFYNLFLKRY